jgi:hypothetical protein
MSEQPTKCSEPKPYNTASLVEDMYCKDCGWPVIHACCNGGMETMEPYKIYDYWAYCSNKACKNHEGEDWGSLSLSLPSGAILDMNNELSNFCKAKVRE